MDTKFVCAQCHKPHPASPNLLACEDCGAPVDVDPSTPITSPLAVTMSEGHTPVVQLDAIGRRLGLRRLYAKLEYRNPTGSFKDRGAAMLVSMLKDHGVSRVAEDSSGNAGAAMAAYSARAGIKATIFVPASAPAMKLSQIAFYGAEIVKVEGGRQAVTEACQRYCREQGVVYASHNLSPYFIEGTKSFAQEVITQMDPPPRHVLFPVGNGSLLIGAWKGWVEAMKDGRAKSMPRLHAVQTEACQPLASAYRGDAWRPSGGVATVAGGIAVERPPRLQQCLQVINDSGGQAVAVSEESILLWQSLLASEEGLLAEPTSAAALAGLEALVRAGAIGRDEVVLAPLTGFGFKDRIPAG
ncbi:MAG: threonine synthase [SAR202 cluster bacterium]|nr:threonine synthase [SAR202 cluster bacterium]